MLCIVPTLAMAAIPVFSIRGNGIASFVRPDGSTFWSLGCDCVDMGTPKDSFQDANPSYSGLRLCTDEKQWVQDTLANLLAWGIDSLGGWSDVDSMRRFGGADRLPYFVVLHLGAWNRAPWDDMFSPTFDRVIEQAATSEIGKVVDDPMLVGYFTDNELGWWGDTLFLAYLKMPPTAPGKQALTALLRRRYRGDFSLLRKDWVATGESFEDPGRMTLKPGGDGIQVVGEWSYTLARRYYSAMNRAVRRHDPRRLILGDRYAQYWDWNVVRASRSYVDAISTNYGCEWNDGSLSRFFLDSLHAASKKPVVVTEFYVNAVENRSGNKNTGHSFPLVATQKERAECFARNLAELASRPYVVGAHWFQYYDEPTHGRSDGEDCNMGLVDIQGKPYEGMIDVLKRLDLPKLRANAKRAVAHSSMPVAPDRPLDGLLSWPRDQGWIRPRESRAFADLYLCADREALYVGILAMDYVDKALYEGGVVPQSERAALDVSVGGSQPVRVRLGSGQNARVESGQCTLAEQPGLKHALILRIPWGRRGRTSFRATLSQHSRAATMSWRAALEPPPIDR